MSNNAAILGKLTAAVAYLRADAEQVVTGLHESAGYLAALRRVDAAIAELQREETAETFAIARSARARHLSTSWDVV